MNEEDNHDLNKLKGQLARYIEKLKTLRGEFGSGHGNEKYGLDRLKVLKNEYESYWCKADQLTEDFLDSGKKR